VKFFPRESGVLLHISSLPGPYGIGEIGPAAFHFIDKLAEMGQCLWQILPVGDTGSDISPYTAVSAYANNPMLISFDTLVEDGYLFKSDLNELHNKHPRKDKVDFKKIVPDRIKILDLACNRFYEKATKAEKEKFERYVEENDFWLNTYTIFLALKEKHHNEKWTKWGNNSSSYDSDFSEISKQYQSFILNLKIKQFLFHNQWQRMKQYANKKGIRIVGDIPIYISHDSADVWANPELFKLDKNGNMRFQSGTPPDFFIEKGQLWRHPIYDWDVHEKTNYQWWIRRFKYLFNLVDIVRIDHFNGFAKYWEIPIGRNNGSIGEWINGPGEKLFLTLKNEIGLKPIMAEDLGEAAPDAKIIRDKFDIPGMKILQTSFWENDLSEDPIPELNHENIVMYTGTHDNDTAIGWFQTKPGKESQQSKEENHLERKRMLEFLHTDGSEINWDFISLALNSKASTAIVPLQDILGLDTKARMNIPGTVDGNWEWRYQEDQLTNDIIKRMRELTIESNRLKRV